MQRLAGDKPSLLTFIQAVGQGILQPLLMPAAAAAEAAPQQQQQQRTPVPASTAATPAGATPARSGGLVPAVPAASPHMAAAPAGPPAGGMQMQQHGAAGVPQPLPSMALQGSTSLDLFLMGGSTVDHADPLAAALAAL